MVAMMVKKKAALRLRVPSQERGEQTVQAIRDAAEKLFATRSFAQVSVAELARRAGIGVGTFYHFYPSKEALLLDLREQLYQRSAASLAQHLPTEMNDGRAFKKSFEALLMQWIAMSVKMRGLERAVAALSFENDAFAQSVRAQELPMQELVTRILRDYRPVLRDVDPDAAARTVVILVDAVIARAMREQDLAENPAPVVREVSRMVARYLLPQRSRP